MLKKFCSCFLLATMIFGITAAYALDAETKATNAVTSILFEAEADDIASYKINEDGFLDITFASNTPDLLYSLLLNKFLRHPDIKGVLAGRGGPSCSRV